MGAKRDKPNRFSTWFNPMIESSFMVTEMGVSLSHLQANHKILCLHCTITAEGIDRVNQIHFDDCQVPNEAQNLVTNRLQGQMRDHLQWCLELETLTRNGHDRPLLACGQNSVGHRSPGEFGAPISS